MSTSLCISTEPILFTRYLYNKTEVKQSLFISLLQRNMDEAMFWAYELYFSGFDTDVFDYIINVYREAYSVLNPKLVLFIEHMVIIWSKDKSEHWTIGSIIATLIYRDYDINSFITAYLNVNCKSNQVSTKSKRKMAITLTNADVAKYKTITSGTADTVLQRGCKYAVHKEYNQLFGTIVPKLGDLQNIYYYHWLYYCLDTPVWRNRIFKYNGQINHEKKTIIFDDEDSLQEFYEHWGYYPDEQPMHVDDKTIGSTFPKKNKSIMDFCNKFNGNPTVKKIKTNNIHHENTTTETSLLTNSITYT